MDEVAIVERFLNELAEKIKANIPNATGKSAESITVEVKKIDDPIFGKIEGYIYGANWIWNLEFGRGPTKNSTPSTPTLRESILEWIKAKNIVSGDKEQLSLSYAISKKIHNEGTKLYRSGQQSGIISDVINDDVLSNFINEFADKTMITITNNVVRQW